MNKIRIVILEDEFIVAEDISTLLTEYGYDVVRVFDNAEEAVSNILTSPPDLLLVDIHLAGAMTGIELVQKVKESLAIPVIYITANSEPGTYQLAKATRPNAFLVKPFTPANLLASIDLALFNFSREETPDRIEKPIVFEGEFETIIHRCLFIKSSGKYRKLCPNDILFVEASGSYVNIQTTEER
ncbi:MAG TPA: hypothetical protein DIS90_14450, partial [Cytophagales bacterium]|nr:hypothetical protein [Cytophagales bacterium]